MGNLSSNDEGDGQDNDREHKGLGCRGKGGLYIYESFSGSGYAE